MVPPVTFTRSSGPPPFSAPSATSGPTPGNPPDCGRNCGKSELIRPDPPDSLHRLYRQRKIGRNENGYVTSVGAQYRNPAMDVAPETSSAIMLPEFANACTAPATFRNRMAPPADSHRTPLAEFT